MSKRKSDIQWIRLGFLGGVLLSVYLIGQFIAASIVQEFDMVMHVRSEPTFHRLIMTASAIYTALMAIPFMPGAEVGISMILVFGSKICFLVYICTVVALIPPYFIGRLVPARYCTTFFGFIGLTKAKKLTEKVAPLSPNERLNFLLQNTPSRVGPFIIQHRYLALIILLNIPGNIVIGGGGGIAMLAGLTGLYSPPAYLFTVAIAVMPVPLIISLTDLGT